MKVFTFENKHNSNIEINITAPTAAEARYLLLREVKDITDYDLKSESPIS